MLKSTEAGTRHCITLPSANIPACSGVSFLFVHSDGTSGAISQHPAPSQLLISKSKRCLS
jgi:hypothetical protein